MLALEKNEWTTLKEFESIRTPELIIKFGLASWMFEI